RRHRDARRIARTLELRSLPEPAGHRAHCAAGARRAGAHRVPAAARPARPGRARVAATRATRPRTSTRLTRRSRKPSREPKRHLRATHALRAVRPCAGAFMFRRLLLSAACALCAMAASAHQYELGTLVIGHPWSRPTAPGMPMGVAYLSITNNGPSPDALVAASSPAAARVEFHQTTLSD